MSRGGVPEPSADSAGSPPNVYGRPPSRFVRPPDVFGRLLYRAGRLPNVFGRLPYRAGRPPDVFEKLPDVSGTLPTCAGALPPKSLAPAEIRRRLPAFFYVRSRISSAFCGQRVRPRALYRASAPYFCGSRVVLLLPRAPEVRAPRASLTRKTACSRTFQPVAALSSCTEYRAS